MKFVLHKRAQINDVFMSKKWPYKLTYSLSYFPNRRGGSNQPAALELRFIRVEKTASRAELGLDPFLKYISTDSAQLIFNGNSLKIGYNWKLY